MKEKIIVALDYDTTEEALNTVDKLGDSILWYKVGSVLFTQGGPAFIRSILAKNKKVFLDLKFYDIPNTVKKACREASLLGVDLITVHLSGGREMLSAAVGGVSEARKMGGKNSIILGVSVLTSLSEEILKSDLRVTMPLVEYIEHLVEMGLKSQIGGIVCSPQETLSLRKKFGNNFLIVNPGIRLAGDSAGDQKRIATPGGAIKDGASYLVIGRSITDDPNPMEKIGAILEDIKSV